ncbi:MAG: hypothetical protein ACR2K1_15490 [Saprospiraceae bacterium]
MKQIFFLLLFPTLLFSQDADSTTVTYENRAGTFFAVTKSFFPTGRVLTDEQPLGRDTNAVANAIIAPVFTAAGQYATQAAQAARIGRPRQQVNAASAALLSLTGQDYYDITNRLLIAEFLPNGEDDQPVQSVAYTMRVDGTPVSVTLRRNAAGQLIMRQGAANFRVDIVSRNWLRIRRYQGTETPATDGWIDLFQERNGNYISADLRYVLRKNNQ